MRGGSGTEPDEAVVVSEDPGAERNAPVSPRWEGLYLIATAAIIVGLYIDGWSHGHVTRSADDFLTPWHLPVMVGYTASALILFRIVARHRAPWSGWRAVSPTGYGPAVLVTFLFALGLLLDLLWHATFGVERDIEALISPTHLFNVAAMAVMVGASFRAWFVADAGARTGARGRAWRAVISIAFVLAAIDFMTMFGNPFAQQFGLGGTHSVIPIAITGFMLQSALLAWGLTLLLQRDVELPVGSVSALLLIPTAGIGFLAGPLVFDLAVAVPAAVAGDALLVLVRRRGMRPHQLWIVPAATATVLWSAYFLVIAVRHGIGWTVHVWVGAIVMGTITAALVAVLGLRRSPAVGVGPDFMPRGDRPAASGTPPTRR